MNVKNELALLPELMRERAQRTQGSLSSITLAVGHTKSRSAGFGVIAKHITRK